MQKFHVHKPQSCIHIYIYCQYIRYYANVVSDKLFYRTSCTNNNLTVNVRGSNWCKVRKSSPHVNVNL